MNHPLNTRRAAAATRRARAVPALLAGVLAALGSFGARAQASAAGDAARQAQIIELQQQERLRELQERALPAPAPAQGADLKKLQPKVAVPEVGPGCHPINELRIEGATLLRDADRAALAHDYAGRCLAADDIQALLSGLTKDYIDRGYVTTRVYLPQQDLGSGTLTLRVVEGTIERYEVRQEGRDARSLWVGGAFPGAPGDVLNLRDLEQGLEQVNGLSSNKATLDLLPGGAPGQSVVQVTNHATRPAHLQLTYDNLGSDSTGRNSVSATGSFDSLLGFNELISLSHTRTLPEHGGHHADATALHAALPYGYNSFSFDASHSTYVSALTLPSGQTVLSNGPTNRYGLGLSRVVRRGQAGSLSVSAQLNVSDTKNYLDGQLLSTNSRELATLNLGASGSMLLAGGAATGRLAYVRGLDAFGALKDLPGIPDDFPHAQFDKFTLDLGYQRRLQLGPLPLQWNAQFAGQHSGQTLFGSEQFLIGSPGTVRGFRMSSLSGDHGLMLRNDLATPWQVASGDQPIRGTFFAAYDMGRVSNHVERPYQGFISSATLGMTAQWQGANAEIFASRALHEPAFLKREGTIVGIRLAYSL